MFKKIWDRSSADRVKKQTLELKSAFDQFSQLDRDLFLCRLEELYREISELYDLNKSEDLRALTNSERQLAKQFIGRMIESMAHGFFSTYCEACLLKEYSDGAESIQILLKIFQQMPNFSAIRSQKKSFTQEKKLPLARESAEDHFRSSLIDIVKEVSQDEGANLMSALEKILNIANALERKNPGRINRIMAGFYGANEAWSEWVDGLKPQDYNEWAVNIYSILDNIKNQVSQESDLSRSVSLSLVYIYLRALIDYEDLLREGDCVWEDSEEVIEQAEIILDYYQSRPLPS